MFRKRYATFAYKKVQRITLAIKDYKDKHGEVKSGTMLIEYLDTIKLIVIIYYSFLGASEMKKKKKNK